MARVRRTAPVIVVAICLGLGLIAALNWSSTRRVGSAIRALASAGSPHERYAARLHLLQAARGVPGLTRLLQQTGIASPSRNDSDAWLASAERALVVSTRVTAPFTMSGTITPAGSAMAWHLPARQGHRIVVTGTFTGTAPFIDLFAAESGLLLASATANRVTFAHEVETDGDLLLRVQPPLGFTGTYQLLERSEPSMTFPVQGLTPRAVQSRFGASRDAGRRSHEGIDIFARRGTPVRAATDGFIGSSTTNRLGGEVVWIWSPRARVSTYYAHLDRQAVRPGQHVSAGTIVGYVGTTGNAAGGPPHLHFGVYARGGSVDPLPFVCGAACEDPAVRRRSGG